MNANEEWYKVIELVRKYGVYKQDLIMEELNPITARVVENVGLYNICSSQRIEVQKRQFKELFNEMVNWKEEAYDVTHKIKYNERSRRRMQKSLMEKINLLEDNWDKLREWLESNWEESQDIWFVKIINKMQELEQGSDK